MEPEKTEPESQEVPQYVDQSAQPASTDQPVDTVAHPAEVQQPAMESQQSEIPSVSAMSNQSEKPEAHETPSRAQELRALLLKVMLGCVIGAATVAVTAILAGGLGDTGTNAIFTVLSATVHVAILFGVVSTTDSKNPLEQRSTNIVINTSMILAVLSFFTSVLGIWGVIDGGIAGRLYATYTVLLFLILHGKTLMDVQAVYDKVRPYVYANYVLMLLVAGLILGAVYAPTSWEILSGFYGRLLAASAIVDVTLSIVVAGMHRLYVQKHPELNARKDTRGSGHNWLKLILIIIFFFFFVGPFLVSLILGAAFGGY
ncbi:hypothetical protein KDA14_02230 [Candidatus Saccharibacteria bacterium]|nr:hypothetical protein [Candidatus Saccharibacteria bacterium]